VKSSIKKYGNEYTILAGTERQTTLSTLTGRMEGKIKMNFIYIECEDNIQIANDGIIL